MTADCSKDDLVAESAPRRGRPGWLQTLIAVPAAVLPLLPSFSCPVCVAAYAGLLSSLGLGFLLTDRVQRPMIVAFLIVSVGSVAWGARQYKKIGPFLLVLIGSIGIVAGRLVWSIAPAIYVGALFVVAGAIWNVILKQPQRKLVTLTVAATRRQRL